MNCREDDAVEDHSPGANPDETEFVIHPSGSQGCLDAIPEKEFGAYLVIKRHNYAKVDDIPVETLAAQGLLKCTRSVCSTNLVPCMCRACTFRQPEEIPQSLGNASSSADNGPNLEVRSLCTRCGQEMGSSQCCQSKTATKSRAGERQQQADARTAKRRKADEEAATLRPRAICEVQDARTPAQLALARLRERITTK